MTETIGLTTCFLLNFLRESQSQWLVGLVGYLGPSSARPLMSSPSTRGRSMNMMCVNWREYVTVTVFRRLRIRIATRKLQYGVHQRKAWSNLGRKVQRPRPLWPLRLLRPCIETYKQLVRSLFVEDTLQDALKAQPSLLPRRKTVERLCITSYKMMVHMILSYPPWGHAS